MTDHTPIYMDDDEFMDWCDERGLTTDEVMDRAAELYAEFQKEMQQRMYSEDPTFDWVCELCGEKVREDQRAEMYDPRDTVLNGSVICHADCGLARGLEVA